MSAAARIKPISVKCCRCENIVDTMEVHDGGDLDGCQLPDGRWVCSFGCWEAEVGE